MSMPPMSIPPISNPMPMSSMIPAIAAARLDSESKRKVAEATTVSPTASPSVTNSVESPRIPTVTGAGTMPPPLTTNARSRSPVGSTAVSGTMIPRGVRARIRTVAYIMGLMSPVGFGTSMRTLKVRVSASSVGIDERDETLIGASRRASSVTSAGWPTATRSTSCSKISGSIQTDERSAIR